jgi:hypothetical protein
VDRYTKKNEELLRQRMLVSHIHRKKPAGRPMPERTARANAKKSAVRAHIEHVFAEQKARMRLFVRTIGLARATTKIGLANLVYNNAPPALAGTPAGPRLTIQQPTRKRRPPPTETTRHRRADRPDVPRHGRRRRCPASGGSAGGGDRH